MAKLTYAKAIREMIAQEMRRDEKVFVMGEDVKSWAAFTAAPMICIRNSVLTVSAILPFPSLPSSAQPWVLHLLACVPSLS